MNIIKEKLKQVNTLFLLISIALAIIFTCFSPHLYIKSEFWKNEYSVPENKNLTIEVPVGNNYKEGLIPIGDVEELKNVTCITDNIEKSNRVRVIDDDMQYTFFLTVSEKYNRYKFSFIPNNDKKLTFLLPKSSYVKGSIRYYTFKVNQKEYVQALNDKSITLDVKKNKKIIIEMRAKYATKDVRALDYINWFSLLLVFLFYLTVNYIAISYIKKYSLKEHVYFLKTKIAQNKIFLLITFFFFVFFVIINCYSGTHINYFAKYWTIIGDVNYSLMNIMYSTTKRFHPYVYLPFYPFLDFLFIVTKNFLMSIFLVYTAITVFTIGFLYKISESINEKNVILNILLTFIFGFSWTVILQNYNYDAYSITAFYLSLIIYLIIKEIKAENKSKLRIALIGIFCALSFGVTISNIFPILILLTVFLFSKKRIKQFLVILFVFLICSTACVLLKDGTCGAQARKDLFYSGTKDKFVSWFNVKDKNNFKNFKNKTIREPIASNNKQLSNIFFFAWLSIVMAGLILSFTQRKKLNKDDRRIYYSLLGALLYNLVSVYFWASSAGLLFSPNHFILWFILLGYSFKFINISLGKYNYLLNNKFVYTIIFLFVILQICNNYHENKLVQARTLEKFPLTFNVLERK